MFIFKYLIIFSISFLPVFSQAKLYFGYQFSVGSKGGFVVGVDINNQQTIETTFKKKTGTVLATVFLKQSLEDMPNYYSLVGYSFFMNLDRFRLGTGFQVHALNVGLGRSFYSEQKNWQLPIEAGVGPAYHSRKKKTSINGFAGFSTLYHIKQ